MTMNPHDIISDLSIVIQGRILGDPNDPYERQLTARAIASIRNLLPEAEIILSTWEDSDHSHLDYDKLVLNEDPGGTAYNEHQPDFLNNNNRQIVSTYNGLKAATRKYAIKMRGDIQFLDTEFTNYLDIDFPRGGRYRFFKQRVIILTQFSRNPRRVPQLIHPSDLFQFGLTEDLLDLWEIPLQPEPETTRAFPLEYRIINNSLENSFYRMKFGSEQYIWYAFCKKHGLDLELKHFGDVSTDKIVQSEESIMNNFMIVDARSIGVLLPKRFIHYPYKDLYTTDEWNDLAKRYATGASLTQQWSLITQVHLNNLALIARRAKDKMLHHGPVKFFKVQKKPMKLKINEEI
jgi:hypothetical protein